MPNRRFTFFTLLQATTFPSSLLFLFMPAFGETTTTLFTGITSTNNLEVQALDVNPNTNDNLNRTGFETGISLNKQSLDYTGGYIVGANASFNKGISGGDDITNISLSASKLSAITPDWLLRTNITANQHKNDALPDNSYKGLILDATFGYLDKGGGGTDISLTLNHEQHDQTSTTTSSIPYNTNRSSVALSHYLPHKKDKAYISFDASFKNNNATDDNRDYDSLGLGVHLNQLRLASFKGRIGLNWQQNDYNQSVLSPSVGTTTNTPSTNNMSPNMPTSGNTSQAQRKDNVYSASLQLGKSLSPKLGLQLSANVGRYDSTISDSEGFYSLALRLAWKL